MDNIGFLLLFQVILIALNAIFACAEIAVLSVSEAKLDKLAEQGNKKARRLRSLTQEPARFLATIQVAITLSGFLGSAFAADNFSDIVVDWILSLGVAISRATLNTVSVVLITLILSYFTLIFGELVPKRLAMKKSESVALGVSGLVSGISILFKPVVWFLSISTNAVLRLCGIDPHEEDEQVSEEEIRMMVDAGSEKGTIDEEEKEFIQNVFEFDDLSAGDIATHRTEVVILWSEDDDAQWAQTIHDHRHNLYPVCGESADDVLGILNAKDYFRLADHSRKTVLGHAVKPAYFVPETIKADVLFRNMKKNRYKMAIVLDEYGGMVGIVTINDLVEELVGELQEELPGHGGTDPYIEPMGENRWSITGNISLSDLEDALEITLENEDYDTLTGLVFDTLDMIPQDGKQDIELEVGTLHIRVLLVEDHQVVKAILTRRMPETDEEDD